MNDKAIEKINAGMQKNANDPYAEIIGQYIIDRCLDGTAAGLVLKKDKTLSGAMTAVLAQSRKAKRGNAAVLTPAAVFGAVDRYFGFSTDLSAQWKALNGSGDPVVSEAPHCASAPALDLNLDDFL